MGEKGRIDWEAVISGVGSALEFFSSQGVKPTLRTLFYNLFSKGLIPNTKTSYQGLSKHLVKARKEGVFAWDFMEDKTRTVRGQIDDDIYKEEEIEELEVRLEDKLESLDIEELIDSYFDYTEPYLGFGRWAKQSNIIEIWIEKEALASTIENWTRYFRIPIRINRGYSGWTFIYNNIEDLKNVLERHDKVTVLYMGDLDPSGEDIERFLNDVLGFFNIPTNKIEIIRLGVTDEQVEQYNLPPMPTDEETLAKLQRDPRMKSYSRKYIVELDALVAYVPEEFRKLIENTVNSYWDKELYQQIKDKAEELREKAKELIEDAKDKAREKMREY